jgi:hypothetical protein
MNNECKFELDFIPCSDCGIKTEEQGTCSDYALCFRCKKKTADELNKTLEEFEEKDYRESQLISIEGHKYRFRKRAMHFQDKKILCNPRGGPHPTTDKIENVTCKKCFRKLTNATSIA